MRVLSFSVICVSLIFICTAPTRAQISTLGILTSDLSLGSSGPQVVLLQKLLNRDPITRIAVSGPGSTGNETGLFGPLTQAAVVRFQEKYAVAILIPAKLPFGNGRVGSYTRAVLNNLDTANTEASATPTSSVPMPTETTPDVATQSPPVSTATQNSNLKNIDKFYAALDKVAAKQGIPSGTVALLKQNALEHVLSASNDIQAEFRKAVEQSSHKPVANNSVFGKMLAALQDAVTSVFMPERARASTGVPFGGAELFAIPCNGGVWNITLEPLPPTYPVLLSYESGTQAFLSYNIPFTTELLGAYLPVPMAYCWIGIYPYPSEGLITPEVGSAPL